MRRRRRSSGARATIEKSLGKFVEKGKLSAATATRRCDGSRRPPTLEMLADSDYVVEAIFEDLHAKCELFARLDTITQA